MLDWDKNKTVNISTVSETFGIPASTLRYWESMGLITLGRRDNNYREYSYSSLLNLSDICYLRNLGIPVKAIKEYQTLSLADSNALYLNKKSELEAQISSLQSTYSMLRKTLSLMNELEYIQKHPYTEAQPDIPLILQSLQALRQGGMEKILFRTVSVCRSALGSAELRMGLGMGCRIPQA